MKLTLLNVERGTHGIKTALACIAGIFFTKTFNIYPDPWLVITVLVVMCAQLNVGSLLQKSYMRFLGTLSGSLIAIITIRWIGVSTLSLGIVITLSALLFSYIATGPTKWSEAGTLGAVTVTVILMSQNPTLITAMHRCLEISMGIVLAGFISQFILPVHAKTHLRKAQAKTIFQLRDYYLKTLLKDEKNYIELDEIIVKSLINQRKLAGDAAREPFGASFSIGHFNQYLWYAREILRSMSFMHQAFDASPACKKVFFNISAFHDGVCNTLSQIAEGIERKNVGINKIYLPTIAPLKKAILREQISEADIISIDAFLFCAEILIVHIGNLLNLVKDSLKIDG